MTPIIQGSDLTKIFGLEDEQIPALKDASLSIQAGDMVAIFGQSGAGKSTLLQVLSGLQRPDAGEVRINGTDVTQLGVRDVALTGC